MNKFSAFSLTLVLLTVSLFNACARDESPDVPDPAWETVQDTTSRVQNITGFSGPEAVRYDPEQDVYFVSNFAGGGSDRDANGFISRVAPDGMIDDLQFMTGTDEYPLHAPRGMVITGDTLWAADIDGVHGFNRTSGEQVQFVDFTDFEPGFLNDIVQDGDNLLYVTDMSASRLFLIENGTVSVLVDSLPHSPNGITMAPSGNQLVLAPWNEALTFYAWNISEESLEEFVRAESGGNFDGIEFVDGRLLAASQVDSSLHVIEDGTDYVLIHTPGRPADIGLDTQRNQVAVPYIALDRVDIWQLPD
ncbi:MAG: hypothetical protein WD317_11550 [Balneolaceae bacterium]